MENKKYTKKYILGYLTNDQHGKDWYNPNIQLIDDPSKEFDSEEEIEEYINNNISNFGNFIVLPIYKKIHP